MYAHIPVIKKTYCTEKSYKIFFIKIRNLYLTQNNH